LCLVGVLVFRLSRQCQFLLSLVLLLVVWCRCQFLLSLVLLLVVWCRCQFLLSLVLVLLLVSEVDLLLLHLVLRLECNLELVCYRQLHKVLLLV